MTMRSAPAELAASRLTKFICAKSVEPATNACVVAVVLPPMTRLKSMPSFWKKPSCSAIRNGQVRSGQDDVAVIDRREFRILLRLSSMG